MRVVAVANQKGGSTKTATAVSLAAVWARQGHRVLLVDIDPQAQASTAAGVGREALSPGMAAVFLDGLALQEAISPSEVPGLDVATSEEELYSLDVRLANAIGREYLLTRALETVADRYDLVVIDTPPALGVALVNAVLAAAELGGGVLIPCTPEPQVVEGLGKLLATLGDIRQALRKDVPVLGVGLTKVEKQVRVARELEADLRAHPALTVFQARVPKDVRMAEAPGHGLPITRYAPKSPAAVAYTALAREVAGALQLPAVQPA